MSRITQAKCRRRKGISVRGKGASKAESETILACWCGTGGPKRVEVGEVSRDQTVPPTYKYEIETLPHISTTHHLLEEQSLQYFSMDFSLVKLENP